jgi:hypothetical protein
MAEGFHGKRVAVLMADGARTATRIATTVWMGLTAVTAPSHWWTPR